MANFLLSEPHYIGLEISGSSIRMAEICRRGKKWKILSLHEISSEEHVKLLQKQFKGALIVSTLNSRDLLVRPCEIQLKKTKDLIAALDFHIEPLLPYPIEQAIVQKQINEQSKHSTLLSIFAVRKDHLTHHLDRLKGFQINPETITSKAHALAAFSTLLSQAQAPLLVVHEGDGEISFALVEKGKVLTLRTINTRKDLKYEIQKTLLNISSTHKSKPFDTIYFLGKDPDIKELLRQEKEKIILAPSSPFINQSSDELTTYGLAIGCAMVHNGINFRQKEFSYPHPFRRLQKPLMIFLALSLLSTSAIYLLAESVLTPKKHSLEEAYSSLMRAEGKTLTGLNFPKTPLQYFSALEELGKEICGQPETHPLLPQIPKVKEVLGWLASLRESEGIILETFNYQLIKFPDFSKKHEKYQARIEMEVSVQSPNGAKAFQEALKQKNPLIDHSQEVIWTPIKGKYRASFYLKDKTQYH